MIWTLLSLAHAQTVTGGIGVGAFAGFQALNRIGWTQNMSIEVAQLTEEVPWLGIGAEAVVGFQPKFCTTCNVQGTLRVGAGPVFRQRSSYLMIGARYSILGDRRLVRPFARTLVPIPVSRMVFRPFLWVEGITATEVGAGLEIGFKVKKDGTFVIRDAKPEDQVDEPVEEEAPLAIPPTEPAPEPKPDIE